MRKMRKILFSTLTAAALLSTSCQKADLGDSASGSEQNITVSVAMDGVTGTRAFSDYGTGEKINRCILEVYYGDNDLLYKRMVAQVDEGLASFDLRLVNSQEYTFVAWADNVEDVNSLNTDRYYITTNEDGLKDVEIKSLGSSNGANYNTFPNTDELDAFFGATTLTVDKVTNVPLTLKRPFGQLSVVTKLTDVIDDLTPGAFSRVFTTSTYKRFNAFSGDVVLMDESDQTTFITPSDDCIIPSTHTVDRVNNELHISTEYVFAPKDSEHLVNVEFVFRKADMTAITNEKIISNIPVKRNYRTIVSGELLTSEGRVEIVVNPLFDAEQSFVVDVKSVDELNDYLDQFDGTEDVKFELEEAPAEGQAIVIPESLKAKSVEINFTSATTPVVIETQNEAYAGDINVKNSSTDAMDLTVAAPKSHVTVSGNFSSINVASSASTCVVLAGAVAEAIVVESGNVSVYGTVKSIVRSETNSEAATKLSIFNGGSVESYGEGIELISVPDFYNYTTNTSYDDFATLIAAAATNDEVYVGSGVYTYSGNFGKSITIYGANRDIAGAAPQRNPETVLNNVSFYKAPTAPTVDIVFDGVELTGSTAVNYQGGGNITARNCIFSSTTSAAGSYPINYRIVYTDCTRIAGNMLFENNLFKPSDDVTLNEFWIWGCKYSADKYTCDVNVVIKNNVFDNTYMNIGFSNNIQEKESVLDVQGNTFRNVPYQAIYATAGAANGAINITGNTFEDMPTAIVKAGDQTKYTISGNTFTNVETEELEK